MKVLILNLYPSFAICLSNLSKAWSNVGILTLHSVAAAGFTLLASGFSIAGPEYVLSTPKVRLGFWRRSSYNNEGIDAVNNQSALVEQTIDSNCGGADMRQ